MNKLPIARTKNIVVQTAGRDLLVYDLVTHKAFNLNEMSRIIFEACDGQTSFDELKRKYRFTDDLIYFTLDKLQRENLIEGEPVNHFGNLSRREVIRRVGLSSIIALPVISSIIAPQSAQAQSISCLAQGASCTFGSPPACCPIDCPSGGTISATCIAGTCQTFQSCPF